MHSRSEKIMALASQPGAHGLFKAVQTAASTNDWRLVLSPKRARKLRRRGERIQWSAFYSGWTWLSGYSKSRRYLQIEIKTPRSHPCLDY